MPNLNSAKKRLRQSIKRRIRNRSVKSSVKTEVRKVRELVEAGKLDDAQRELSTLAKHADQAAAKGVIHGNAAARIKSRLAHRIAAAKGKTKKPAAS